MPTITLHPRLEQLLQQRCFFLFLAPLALLVVIPFLGGTFHGCGKEAFARCARLIKLETRALPRVNFAITISIISRKKND